MNLGFRDAKQFGYFSRAGSGVIEQSDVDGFDLVIYAEWF